jgi:hypothetical protein
MTTPTEKQIIDKATAFIHDKICTAYLAQYMHATKRAKELSKWDPASGSVSDAKVVGGFFQHLWEELPDNPGIRSKPFFAICDIAELYCFHMAEAHDTDAS